DAIAARRHAADRRTVLLVLKDRGTAPDRAASFRLEPHAPARSAARELCQDRLRAGEAAGARAAWPAALLGRPFKRGLDGCRGAVEVGAVEAEAGLEPQAVARAKSDRRHAWILEQGDAQRFDTVG